MSEKFPLLIEAPHLHLALSGFDAQQMVLFQEWLSESDALCDPSAIRWQVRMQGSPDVVLHALAPQSTPALTKNDLVFAPLEQCFWQNQQEQEQDQESIEHSKKRFMALMSDLDEQVQTQCTRYVLAGMLADRHLAKLPLQGIWHLMSAGEMLAVVDFVSLQVAVRRQTHYLEFDECTWVHRPSMAKAPSDFHVYPIERLMWEYGRRTQRQLLPPRFFKQRISLRRNPRLPLNCMSELELALLASVRQSPQTMAEIAQRSGLMMEQVAHLLGAMYFAGAITTRRLGFFEWLVQSLGLNRSGGFVASHTPMPADLSYYNSSAPMLLGQRKSAQR